MPKRDLEARLQLITERLEAIEIALGESVTADGRNAPEEATKAERERKISGGRKPLQGQVDVDDTYWSSSSLGVIVSLISRSALKMPISIGFPIASFVSRR